MIDFHCHLDLYPDPVKVAAECRRRGLYVLSVTTTPSAWTCTRDLSQSGDRIRTAIGLHPQIAHERESELPLFDELLANTRYVGEVGLDGSRDLRHHWDAQLRVFSHILSECERVGGKIISIHSKRAAAAVLERLETFPGAGVAILHWFSGTVSELERAVSVGCWFSVGPAMLASERGRALAAKMPRERVLTESDGPFAQLGDVPVMPWQVSNAVAVLANLWSISETEAADIIGSNLRALSTASLGTSAL